MDLRAYYQTLTVGAIRRIVGPFSVLADRGHRVYHSYIGDLSQIEGAGYDAILLPNWAMDKQSRELPLVEGGYLYDLSDTRLLEVEDVLNCLTQCDGVLVPNKAAAQLVKPFNANVSVVPSTVSIQWLTDLKVSKPEGKRVLAVEVRHKKEWELRHVPEVLQQLLAKHGDLVVTSRDPDLIAALSPSGENKRALYVETIPEHHAVYVRSSYLALFVGEDPSADEGPIHEFGVFGIPSVGGTGYSSTLPDGLLYSSTEQLYDRLDVLLRTPARYRAASEGAISAGNERRATRMADAYLRGIQKATKKFVTSPVSKAVRW